MKHTVKKIINIISDQTFNPTLIGIFTNPFYFARKGLRQNIVEFAPFVNGRVLDVGCGSKPYQSLFSTSEYTGMEIENGNPNADCYYDGKRFPFADGEFDAILTFQVLEHVFNPEEFLSEINRVLKNGGILLLAVPFVWDEHEQPYDYARYSSYGLSHLLEKSGFDIIKKRKSMDDVRVIFQMLNAYIYKKTITENGFINIFTTLVLMAPINVLGEIFGRIFPHNSDLYLDNIVLAKKGGNSIVHDII